MDETPPPEVTGARANLIAHDRLEPLPPEPWAPEPWTPGPPAPLGRTHRWVFAALMAVSAILHFARLGSPGAVLPATDKQCMNLPPLAGAPCHELIQLDEVHYVPDARDTLTYGTASDERVPDGEGRSGHYVVHPPVGKWFIAAGIKLFGDSPFGWRFFGAVFGTLSTAVMYLLARRLWASPWWAALAAFLLTVEGLWFVQSRVAMLDIYAGFFVLAAMWMLLEDRDRTDPDHRGFRWWRWCSALMIGLAVSTKWSVAPYVAIGLGMAYAWEMIRASRGTRPRRIRRTLAMVALFLLVPATVYVAAETPWFLNKHRYSPSDCADPRDPEGAPVTGFADTLAGEWLCYQGQVFSFHRNLQKFDRVEAEEGETVAPGASKPGHPYFGEAYSWPWIGRPVAHHYVGEGEGTAATSQEVLGLPNPVIWWSAFALIPFLIWWTARRGDPVASLILGMIIAGWAPYLFADAIDRPVFLFYATPMVPFLVLAVTHALVRFTAWVRTPWVPVAYAVLAAGMFAYFYPVLAAVTIPRSGFFGWQMHMWLSGTLGDCTVQNAIKIRCWI